MPYPNEGACRLRDPGDLTDFHRSTRKHDGKTYSVIYAKPKAGGGITQQAFRYPRETWSTDDARAHCKSHGGTFEAATGKTAGGRMKFHTATMSHNQIRSKVQQALDTRYPAPKPEPMDFDVMPWAMEVYDGHVIHSGGPGKGLYKQTYKLEPDGSCELTGDPEEVEPGYVTKVAMNLSASKVTTGDDTDAQALMDELCEKNPLIGSLKDSPNTHLVIFDLTSIGKPSNHEGDFHYQLAKSGLKDALPTLISKPIHVTAGFDGHFTAGEKPLAIGVFLGGVVIDQADGSQVLRAVGTLWDGDFPDIVEDIKKDREKLGASYEIAYLAASASRLGGKVIEIGKYEFSGGALLYKSSAAHPETQLLVADADTELARKTTHKGGASMKYPGIPAELETVVDALIASVTTTVTAAVTASVSKDLGDKFTAEKTELEAKLKKAAKDPKEPDADDLPEFLKKKKAEIDELETKITAQQTEIERLKPFEAKATELTAALDVLKEQHATATAELEKIAGEKKMADTVAALKADYGLTDEQLKEEKRAPLVAKQAAGKEPLSIAEWKQLMTGAQVPGVGASRVPLFAGGGDPGGGTQPKATPEEIARNFPAAARKTFR